MAVICRLGHLIFCPFLRTAPAFSTILPFYLVVDSSFFMPNNLLLTTKNLLLKAFFALIQHLFSPKIEHLCLCIQCILIHFALRFGAKCTAFLC